MTQAERQQQPHEEQALLDYACRLDKSRAGHRAIHVHLSRLRPYNRRPHHLRIAASTFEPLIQAHNSALFRLFDGDMVLVSKNASGAELDECVLRLRYLFSEDPLLTGREEPGQEFCTWYDLETDYSGLRDTWPSKSPRRGHKQMRPSNRRKGGGPGKAARSAARAARSAASSGHHQGHSPGRPVEHPAPPAGLRGGRRRLGPSPCSTSFTSRSRT